MGNQIAYAKKSSNEQIFFQKMKDLNNPKYLGNSAQAAIEKTCCWIEMDMLRIFHHQ
jgi:uncharacterized protein YbcV (DUF1398 family)